MKRVLMLASVASMIDQFNMPNIQLLQELGYEVDVACNFQQGNTCSLERIEQLKRRLEQAGVQYYQIDFERRILNFKQHGRAYFQVKEILKRKPYEFIHCHSPIGGVIGRLAGRAMKVKVIYTAHGFHFYQGAPVLNWLVFYPVEKWLSRYTDILITMNGQDYNRAVRKFRAKRVEYIHGVGIDSEKFSDQKVNIEQKKESIGLSHDAFVLLSVGELNKNKNHSVIIRALAQLGNAKCQYVICGKGEKQAELKQLAKKMGVDCQVHFLGFRTDVSELYASADIFLFPSKREGLPVALMEAMASGLPAVASRIRGNVDLVLDEETGYLVDTDHVEDYAEKVKKLMDEPEIRINMGMKGRKRAQEFDKRIVCQEMKKIYQELN